MYEKTLSHVGVLGMKWGVRRGRSTTGVSRSSGAIIDRNARTRRVITDARSGKKYKLTAAVGKALVGEKKQQKNWNTRLNDLKAQDVRMRSGEKTIKDRLDKFATVGVLDLVVSIRPA